MSAAGRVLVTGGGGRLARQLGVWGGDAVRLARREDLDITASAEVGVALDRLGPALVINAAAVSNVEAAVSEPARAFAVNAAGPGVLAEACLARSLPLIHISTDYVFGAPTERPWREDDPVSPVNPYGAMKAEGERRVLASGVSGCVVRVAWLFGDGEDFLARTLSSAGAGSVVRAADDQFGSPSPLGPLAELLLRLADRLSNGEPVPRILHLAGSPAVSRADWLAAALDGFSAAGGVAPRLERASLSSFASASPRPSFSALDTSRAEAVFGQRMEWRPAAHEVGRRHALGAGPLFPA